MQHYVYYVKLFFFAQNKRLNEENNALHVFKKYENLFAFLCKTTYAHENNGMLIILKNVANNHTSIFFGIERCFYNLLL